ncbi:bone morphogenetic protein 2-like [Glandiceps talaboti]
MALSFLCKNFTAMTRVICIFLPYLVELSYVDSTQVMNASIHPNDYDDIGREFLALFGLTTIPEISGLKPHPPKYMLDLYTQLQLAESTELTSSAWQHVNPTNNQHNAMSPNNEGTIQSYLLQKGQVKRGFDNLTFKYASSMDAEMTAAEIILTRRKLNLLPYQPHMYSPYLTTHKTTTTDNVNQTIYPMKRSPRYDAFDVTNNIKEWLAINDTIEFTVQLNTVRHSFPDGFPSPSFPHLRDVYSLHGSLSPLLVLYRGIKPPSSWAKPNENRGEDDPVQYVRNKRKSKKKNFRKDCKLRDWHVNFKDLGWEFILQPHSIDVNVCKGDCPVSMLGSGFNATHHAFMRYLVRAKKVTRWQRVPRVHCVPVSYKPLTVLYQVNEGFDVKRLPDVLPKSCGCR